MSAEELAGVRADIAANGVQTAVVIWRESPDCGPHCIIDGRHRAAIADELGIDYPTREFVGDFAAMLRHVLSLNLHRRNLDTTQRAAIFVKAGGIDALKESRKADGKRPRGNLNDEAAKLIDSSGQSVKRARKVQAADPAKLDAVIAGKTSLTNAFTEAGGKIGHAERNSFEGRASLENCEDRESLSGDDALIREAVRSLEAVAGELTKLRKRTEELGNQVPTWIGSTAGIVRSDIGSAANYLRQAAETLRGQKPVAICPYCKGGKCAKCQNVGMMNKTQFNAVPPEKRAA